MHSHNYRIPEPFRDQIVVVIGSGPSAIDISREIAMVAKQVHMSSRSPLVKVAKSEKFNNVWKHSKINCVSKDGWITFQDGFSIDVDIILHCTGYEKHIPFLKTNGIVNVEDTLNGHLYKHVFSPQLAPRLSFVGIPESIFSIIIWECQSRWIAHALSMKVSLPSKDEMLHEVRKHCEEMKHKGLPVHRLVFQIDYMDWMSAQTGLVVEKNIKDMMEYAAHCIMTAGLEGYMDVFSKKYGR